MNASGDHHNVVNDESQSTCLVSGLPIITRPEWTDLGSSDCCRVTFRLIGDRILHLIPRGTPDSDTIAAMFEHARKLADDMIGVGTPLVVIDDYSRVNDTSSRSVRKQMVDGLMRDRHRLLGYICFSASLRMRLAIKVSRRLFKFPFPVLAVKDYQAAVTQALALLPENRIDGGGPPFTSVSRKEWQFHAEDGMVEHRLINGNIIYSNNTGSLSRADVAASLERLEKIVAYTAARAGGYYLVVAPQQHRLSREIRAYYIDYISRLYARYPFRCFIFCRSNRFFRTVFYLARPRLKFPALITRDLDGALQLISSLESGYGKAVTGTPSSSDRNDNEVLSRVVDDLLHYLGSINWEIEGRHEKILKKSGDDPLKPVYDAIDLIKADVDDLFFKRQQAEQKLWENMVRQSGILESIDDGYYECDLSGTITMANRALYEIYREVSRDELTGLNYRQYMDEKTAVFIAAAFNEVYRTGRPNRSIEIQVIGREDAREDARKFVEVSASLIRNDRDEPSGFRGIVRDVTRRREDRERLEMFRRFIESSGEGVGWSDLEGKIVYVNETMCRILGEESLEKALGKYVVRYYDQNTRRRIHDDIQPIVHRDGEWKGELTVCNSRGQRLPTLNDIFVIRDENGRIRYHAVIARDISDLKNAEQALRESEEKYRLLVNNAGDAICIAQDDVLKFVNPRVVTLLEYPPAELARRSFMDLIHPEDAPLVREYYQRRLDGEIMPDPHSFRVFSKSGRLLWVQNNTVRISWDGRPAVLNFIRDITRQKSMEDHLRQSMKMEAIGTLAGGIAHDFNNILAAVMGYTEVVLGETPQGSRAYRNLRQIRKAVMRARDLVRQILAFSRPGEEALKPLQLSPIVREVLKMIEATAPAGVDIVQQIPPGGVTVLADPTQIHEVVMNLCTNAIQAMNGEGKLSVEITEVALDADQLPTHKDLSPGRFVRLAIQDTGPGMPAEIGQRVFEPYFTTRPHDEGTGLGLSVVHGIMENLGGFITVDSRVDVGTVFAVFLPAVEEKESSWESVSAERPLPGGRERILLVDNSPQLIDSGRQILEYLGYVVETSSDSLAAKDILQDRAGEFDLVITDVEMPKMTGDELAEMIYNIHPQLPVILYSGNIMNAGRREGTGIRKYMPKPFVAADLAWAIREVLDADGDSS